MDPLGHFGVSGLTGHCPEYPGHQVADLFLAVERVADLVFGAGFCFGIDPGIYLGEAFPKTFLGGSCF